MSPTSGCNHHWHYFLINFDIANCAPLTQNQWHSSKCVPRQLDWVLKYCDQDMKDKDKNMKKGADQPTKRWACNLQLPHVGLTAVCRPRLLPPVGSCYCRFSVSLSLCGQSLCCLSVRRNLGCVTHMRIHVCTLHARMKNILKTFVEHNKNKFLRTTMRASDLSN